MRLKIILIKGNYTYISKLNSIFMLARIPVGDLMTRNFEAIKPSDSLFEASRKMAKKRVNSLLIVSHTKLHGIITARDILWTITKKPGVNLKKIKVIDICTKKVAVIKPSADLSQALEKMRHLSFRRLPVISKGKVVGMLTLKDILRVDPSLYSELGELSRIREEPLKISRINNQDYEIDGICEECDTFSTLLKVDGQLLCQDCRDELY